jgi:amino acid transporter
MVLFVLSAATPLTVYTGIIPTGFAQTGQIGIPAAFGAVGLVMCLFFAGFTKMAPRIGNPGSFAGYLGAGLGRIAGMGGAAVAVLAYSILLWGLFGYVGSAAGPLAQKYLGWDLPWWAYALAAWALVGWLGHRRVRDAGRVVGVLLGLEIITIVVCSVTNVLHPANGVTTDTLSPASLVAVGSGAVLALAVVGFIGIESVVVFARECDDPARSVPLAAYVAIGVSTVLYAVSSWTQSVATGPDGIVGASQAYGPELVSYLIRPHLGAAAVDVLHALLLTSVLSAMVSFHNCSARYVLSLGKEHVLPRVFGRTSAKTGAPTVGSLAQSGITLLVIGVYALSGLDPVRFLFYWAGASGAVGVLMLMTATAWSIVIYFVRTAARRTPIRWWVTTVLAAIGVTWVLVEALDNFALLLGETGSQPTRIILVVFGGVAAIGIAWGIFLRLERPEDYRAIGLGGTLGAAASTGTTTR